MQLETLYPTTLRPSKGDFFSPYSSCSGGQRPLIRVEGRRHGGDRVRKCAVFLKWTGALNIVNGTKNQGICHLIPNVVVYRVSGIEIHSKNGKIQCESPQKMWGWHEKRILRVRMMEKQIVNKLTLSKYYYRAYLRGYALLMGLVGILMYSKFTKVKKITVSISPSINVEKLNKKPTFRIYC